MVRGCPSGTDSYVMDSNLGANNKIIFMLKNSIKDQYS